MGVKQSEKDRKKELNKLMEGDVDEPSKWDLFASSVILTLMLCGTLNGWW